MTRLLAPAFFLLILVSVPAVTKADSIVLNSTQQGWYSNNGNNNGVSNTNNYFAGASSGGVYRNYFVFDLTYIKDVTSVQLRLYKTGDSNLTADPSETYALYDVQTPAELLGRTDGVSIFDDLGSGPVFASATFLTPPFYDGEFVTFNLGSDAIAAIQRSGGLFAIGGAITTLRSPVVVNGSEGLFGGSQGRSAELIVNGRQVPTPEPGTFLLLGSGLAGVAASVCRRRQAHRESRNLS